MIEPPNLIGVWRHIRQHIEQKRYSEALDNLKLYGELERAYALAVMEQQRESTASEKTDRTAAQPDMTEQLAEALKEIIICVWSDNFKDSDAKLDAIDERAEHALSSECSDDKA